MLYLENMNTEKVKADLNRATEDFVQLVEICSDGKSLSQEMHKYVIKILEISKKIEDNQGESNELDDNIANNAFFLVKSSISIFFNLRNYNIMESSRKETGDTYSNITDCIVSLLNVIDFESPSWYAIKQGHLKSGIEFVAAKSYVLRTYMPLEDSKSEDFINFPEV